MMRLAARLLAAAVVAVPLAASAGGEPPPELVEAVHRLLDGGSPDRIEATPMPGVWEVAIGTTVVYLSGDGRYLLRGDLIDVDARRNLTKEAKRVARRSAIERVAESSMIVFAPERTAHTVTVFTDVDCPYCARLHERIAGYNERGIKVRYLAFPRAGIPSESYSKTVSVWCADDPREAIGRAKRGESVPRRECENPVSAHYRLGQAIGISGTPAIVLDDGDIVPGFVPPAELARILDGGEPG